jgi:hypothetical protein
LNSINEGTVGLTIEEHEKAEVRQCAKRILLDLEQAQALLGDCPLEEMQERVSDAAALMKKIAADATEVIARHRLDAQTVRH